MTARETELRLSGLRCAGCVGKIEKALLAVAGVTAASVNLADRTARIAGTASSEELVNAVESVGFDAELASGVQTSAIISVAAMNCASCVGKIETSLQGIDAVKGTVNLADKTVLVESTGHTDIHKEIHTVLSALAKAGFPGTVLNLEEGSFEQQQAQQETEDRRRYRYLLKHTAIALGLGIPLMIWGMVTGEMGVNSPQEQIAWGVVGVVTGLILYFSGGHFFTGLWQSLKHRNANMDTLVALGTGAAWLFSMIVVMFPGWLPNSARHVYFEASAMIIGLINLGQALELRARGKTSEAVKTAAWSSGQDCTGDS